jgi:hypothetical protein
LSDIAVVAAAKVTAPTDLFVHQQTVALVNERANDQHLAPFAFQLIRESRETGSLPVPRHTDSTDHGVQPPCGLLFAFASKIPFINIVVFGLVSRLSGGFSEIFSNYFLASEIAGQRLQVTLSLKSICSPILGK